MSREIKFRVWNGEMMSMPFYPWEIKDDCTGGKMTPREGVSAWWPDMKESDGVLWLQFTGLKDKNGKEIFEGDLWQFSDFPPTEIVCHYGAFGYWVNKDFKAFAAHGYRDEILADSVVIGNIYELPAPTVGRDTPGTEGEA